MAKKTTRYTDAERAVMFAEIERNGLTQVAAAQRHGVSTVTIWQWKRAAKTTRPHQARTLRTSSPADDSLDGLLRAQVRDRIREILPKVVREEVANCVRRVLAPGK